MGVSCRTRTCSVKLMLSLCDAARCAGRKLFDSFASNAMALGFSMWLIDLSTRFGESAV